MWPSEWNCLSPDECVRCSSKIQQPICVNNRFTCLCDNKQTACKHDKLMQSNRSMREINMPVKSADYDFNQNKKKNIAAPLHNAFENTDEYSETSYLLPEKNYTREKYKKYKEHEFGNKANSYNRNKYMNGSLLNDSHSSSNSSSSSSSSSSSNSSSSSSNNSSSSSNSSSSYSSGTSSGSSSSSNSSDHENTEENNTSDKNIRIYDKIKRLRTSKRNLTDDGNNVVGNTCRSNSNNNISNSPNITLCSGRNNSLISSRNNSSSSSRNNSSSSSRNNSSSSSSDSSSTDSTSASSDESWWQEYKLLSNKMDNYITDTMKDSGYLSNTSLNAENGTETSL